MAVQSINVLILLLYVLRNLEYLENLIIVMILMPGNQSLQTQTGFTDYTWYIDNLLHSGPSNWGYSYNNNSTVGTYDITVSFEDNNGCTGTSDPFILKVHPTPNPVSVFSNGICPGSQITLTHTGGQN